MLCIFLRSVVLQCAIEVARQIEFAFSIVYSQHFFAAKITILIREKRGSAVYS